MGPWKLYASKRDDNGTVIIIFKPCKFVLFYYVLVANLFKYPFVGKKEP